MRLLLVTAALGFAELASCSLNPQPLPPDAPMDAGERAVATPTTGAGSGSSSGEDLTGDAAAGVDAAARHDASTETPPGDGAADAGRDAEADAPPESGTREAGPSTDAEADSTDAGSRSDSGSGSGSSGS